MSARTERIDRENVLWHALAKGADKLSDRDRLVAGKQHNVSAAIVGQVDGEFVELNLDGVLIVNHDTTFTENITPAIGRVLAYVLQRLPEKTREKLLEVMPQIYLREQRLPDVDDELADRCELMLKQLRYAAGSKTRRGVLKFEPRAAAAKAA